MPFPQTDSEDCVGLTMILGVVKTFLRIEKMEKLADVRCSPRLQQTFGR